MMNNDITPKKIKAVIFDLDGTLADTLPLCIAAFRKSIEPLIGKHLSDEEIIATFGPSEEGTILALAPQHYEKGVADYLKLYGELHFMCPVPFEGIKELLYDLKKMGIRIAIVTGKGMHSTEISLKQFGLASYFEIIETGQPSGPVKADGIRKVLNYFTDLSPDEVIYVGDAPSDIMASREAGVRAGGAAWADTTDGVQLESVLPDHMFYDVEDFRVWLKEAAYISPNSQ